MAHSIAEPPDSANDKSGKIVASLFIARRARAGPGTKPGSERFFKVPARSVVYYLLTRRRGIHLAAQSGIPPSSFVALQERQP